MAAAATRIQVTRMPRNRIYANAAQKLQLHIHRLRGLLGEQDRLTYGDVGYRPIKAPAVTVPGSPSPR